MQEDLLKIINHYGVMKQLKYFQSEVFELNEAIINAEYSGSQPLDEEVDHIAEEIADVLVMVKQFKEYYKIDDEFINQIATSKILRQLERIDEENK